MCQTQRGSSECGESNDDPKCKMVWLQRLTIICNECGCFCFNFKLFCHVFQHVSEWRILPSQPSVSDRTSSQKGRTTVAIKMEHVSKRVGNNGGTISHCHALSEELVGWAEVIITKVGDKEKMVNKRVWYSPQAHSAP